MPRWTEEQQLAIDKDGSNIIVSAGAGSGKTAVLTARVLRKLKQNVDIDHLLILTFTKAAALEMKDRIRSAIRKEETLKEQLEKIDASYITTFDSYAFSIVKRYHYLLNVSNKIIIGDSSVLLIKKEELLDEIFNIYYEKESVPFLEMISTFCVKDDNELKKSILDISNKLDLKYDKIDYLKTYISSFFNETHLSTLVEKYESLLIRKIKEVNCNLEELKHCVDGDFFTKMEDVLIQLVEAKTYNEIANSAEIKLPMLPRGSEERTKKIKETISSGIKEIKNMCQISSTENLIKTLLSTKTTVEVFIEIILELDKKIKLYKESNEVYEFTDISKMAIQVLEENKEVREELSRYFNEIMVDEYQDTNDLQERFVQLIENNNVYMVGDIKQSIYRFRNANPNIFKEKYKNYQNHFGGEKIDLNKNFRSREEVLSNINTIFDIIMDEFLGGASYKNSHRMIFGNLTYQNEGQTKENNNFELLIYDPKNEEYKKEELEVFIVANDIKNKVEGNYQIFDKDALVVRNVTYSDFVILMDRSTHFDLYKQIFTSLQIPISIEKDESITNNIDLVILKNIINLIIKIKLNKKDKEFEFSFMSIARSYLYNFSDNEIFLAIKNKEYSLFPFVKLSSILAKKLDHYTIRNLMDDIIKLFPFYEQIITKGDVEGSLNRFEYLQVLATTLEGQGYTVYAFSNYLDTIISSGIDLKYSVQEESGDSCKIMTIHKSKGLEFPVCYYTGLYAKFNISDLKSKFTYDSSLGIITPYFEEGLGQPFTKTLLKDQYLEEEIGEKIRLFYVSLTRAKEKMILVTSFEEETETDESFVETETRLKYRSFKDMLKSIQITLEEYTKKIDLKEIPMSKNYNFIKKSSLDDLIEKTDIKLEEDEYIFTKIEKIKTTTSKVMTEILSEEQERSRVLGNIFHHTLEGIDLYNPNLDGVDTFLIKKIKSFCNLEFFTSNIKPKIYKEYEFIYQKKEKEVHGIIDLLLIYEDKAIIIDYKLKNTQDDDYKKQLCLYRQFVTEKTTLPVKCYLYSILSEELQEIND